jgi:alpha-L-fucosidase 2
VEPTQYIFGSLSIIVQLEVIPGAGTNYDAKRGTAEFGDTFCGADPGPMIEDTTHKASLKSFAELKRAHVEDFTLLPARFRPSLSDSLNSSHTETAELIARYDAAKSTGDPCLENLLFEFANYLFISSSRPGSLPPNLQGRWSENVTTSWSADYHTNITCKRTIGRRIKLA